MSVFISRPFTKHLFTSRTFLQTQYRSLIKHAPGWDESKASNSESAVKADREPVENVYKLQSDSVEYLTHSRKEIYINPNLNENNENNNQSNTTSQEKDIHPVNLDLDSLQQEKTRKK